MSGREETRYNLHGITSKSCLTSLSSPPLLHYLPNSATAGDCDPGTQVCGYLKSSK